jgi:AraC-like DNA-binding protein
MAEPTVGAGYARGLLELAVSKGAGRAALLEQSGLAEADLQDQDGRVAFARYVALMRAGKALSGDPALGLHYGEAVNIADVSIVGLIMRSANGIVDAFAMLNRFAPLIVETDNPEPGERFSLRHEQGGLWVVDNRRSANAFPELTESAFAQQICGPRRAGAPPFVKALRLTHADPGYGAEYERILGAPPVFEADRNAYQVDERLLAQKAPLPQFPAYVFGVLSERATALLQDLQTAQSVRSRVERLLMPVLHKGEASMEAVAGQLGFSRQTLFRKLRAEGATFEKVLDELRHRLALDYLSGRKVSLNEAGYLLGFSDAAAFSRAFKRWTGCSPREARNALVFSRGEPWPARQVS